ncbi:hemerythrin domain-containing protein [Cytobacillus sp. FJAT-54145]|uniref:Hemerythrin domain-containing protein n=1 Tax=Cytobacillus spartinae TaxID=3299023 RepID=A0ABW6KL30_9BACI
MQGCMSSMIGNQDIELSKGLRQLKEEHPSLLKQLENLLFTCNRIDANDEREEAFTSLIDQVKAFFHELEPHSEREEGVLFPMMETYIGKEMGPIAVMEYEHDQAKECIGTFLKATNNKSEFTNEEIIKYSHVIKNAYYILVDHFAKEENILFPMAEKLLKVEEKEDLFIRINEIK